MNSNNKKTHLKEDIQYCQDCNFFRMTKRSQQCRFNPPTYTSTRSGWPSVGFYDWCKEWKAKS